MPRINYYVLSDIAEVDISDIYDYTLEAHGARQAAAYLTGLDESFVLLSSSPVLENAARKSETASILSYTRNTRSFIVCRMTL